ncbi:glycosyl hydrolase family 8 [Gluconacetobacter johannae]|uniref:cellulase n=1 Tax=Gluconacetobacter johannae TaxID=112140 RepID=A0A7W4J9B5_9PROT|nr:glycosyl hydrolase family 8 [Gluconacetobacter johannae]MBB2176852.1 endoglucanase [Gluconacetobacter johannae]
MTAFLARRHVLAGVAGGAMATLQPGGRAARAAGMDDWTFYRRHFVSPDGRVIDNGNGNVSHTEGQGYGMLFAQAFDDRETFDSLFRWTERTLRHQGDALHAWHYLPDAPNHVPESENATDGDLLIALALTLAGDRWGRQDLTAAACAIYAALREKIVVQAGAYTVLLPGLYGFAFPDRVVLNPSYYIMPSLLAGALLDDAGLWMRVVRDGRRLLHQGRFGRWNLPPDWLSLPRVGGVPGIAQPWPPRFSYDAIRVPLYLQWAGMLDAPMRTSLRRYWGAWGADGLPAWVDLKTGERAPYGAPPGFHALGVACGLADPSDFPAMEANTNYYSASLTLLSRLVQEGMAAGIMRQAASGG